MILVTGATGFVGSHVVRRLAAEPKAQVRAMVRDRSAAAAGSLKGAEVVEGDITKPETLPAALSGVERIVHAAAITGNLREPYRGAYDRINRIGTENLVQAAAAAGVSRVVVMSGLGTRPAATGTYMATRWGLEDAVRKSGIPFVILQPSVLFGDGAEFVSALARLARSSPVMPLIGGGRVRFQPLWIEDLVSCVTIALDAERLTGRAIPLGGSEYATFKEVIQTICSAMGVRRLMLPLPLAIARAQAGLMSALLPHPPLTPAAMELFAFENATDLDAVDRDFSFHPRGFREHLKAHGVGG
jgi:uncharacterized protein YbjT (DUF2867 family)